MTHARITNFVDVGDLAAPVGSPAWCKASHLQLCATKRQSDQKVRRLKFHLQEFKERGRWKQLTDNNGRRFRSWKNYVEYSEPSGLGLKIGIVNKILKAPDESLIGTVLGTHGGDRRSAASANQPDNVRLIGYGNRREYTLARLRRDRPDLARQVEAGELSANAAAIEARFRRKPQITCPHCGRTFTK